MLAVSIIVKDAAGRILLRRREKEPDAGLWEVFAGYPRLDELPLETAARRILKEKGGMGEVGSLAFTGRFYDAPGRHPGRACVPLAFVAEVAGAPESEGQRWFSPEEVRELSLALDNKAMLADLGLI